MENGFIRFISTVIKTTLEILRLLNLITCEYAIKIIFYFRHFILCEKPALKKILFWYWCFNNITLSYPLSLMDGGSLFKILYYKVYLFKNC